MGSDFPACSGPNFLGTRVEARVPGNRRRDFSVRGVGSCLVQYIVDFHLPCVVPFMRYQKGPGYSPSRCYRDAMEKLRTVRVDRRYFGAWGNGVSGIFHHVHVPAFC